jgi:hypothetical protein
MASLDPPGIAHQYRTGFGREERTQAWPNAGVYVGSRRLQRISATATATATATAAATATATATAAAAAATTSGTGTGTGTMYVLAPLAPRERPPPPAGPENVLRELRGTRSPAKAPASQREREKRKRGGGGERTTEECQGP